MKPLSILSTVTALTALAAFADPALAQDAAATTAEAAPAGSGTLSAEAQYIFNTFLFLSMGFLVMWMAAGFAMLEAGLVRSKNVSMQLLKNIALYAIAGIMYWVVGYALMYTDVAANGGWFGTPGPYSWPAAGAGSTADGGYSVPSDWFFQMVFCATTASIVSGTLAERIKLWPFLIFTVLLTGIIYPLAGSWKWGAGWLQDMGFQDFAGSTLVHSVGGWAALAGALILGARSGKYGTNGEVNALPGSSMPLATLGTFILWLGWFGFNGGSQLALGTASDAADVSRIFANTNLAAAGGVVVAIILTQILYGKVDITMALNGALAGLVSITAEPLTPSPLMAIIIGGVGAVIVVFAVPLLDKLKIDDVVGAIPVHLLAGIWGTIAVPITNGDASFAVQAIGIVAYGVFAFVVSLVAWVILKMVIGIRVSAEEEYAGLDKAEIGVEAYPEFGTGSQRV
ncbi:Amt family ammonium transporter [Rhodobium orientis]|uniref:Ammonium transporter n=1 Tax=Rhodobium orientis TaxID=34017 RepID=A0A327JS01_9HYPH|nr:ammonium transporter [Rhodobium orientis]MBB4304347.1 Amt family ammonium transporter [Rhodobium orientis]MBK5948159.1 ammonium transporter [Rhodobium orientis]RAI28841.1 ammonium transporter [Rhodobium orientis]